MRLVPQPLSRDGFAPFGEVIETAGRPAIAINDGNCLRYDDLARIELRGGDGAAAISIFRSEPVTPPLRLTMMERHPLGTQAFVPLAPRPFLVVVAPAGAAVAAGDLRAFITDGAQGVSYRPGTWHHPLLALEVVSDFAVVDRIGPGENLDVVAIDPVELIF